MSLVNINLKSALIRAAIIIGILLALGAPAKADFNAKLNKGKIFSISVPKSGIWPGRSMAVIDAPADQVYAILADFASYDQFVPRIAKSRLIKGNTYEIEATFPWPVKKTRATLSVRKGKRGTTRIVQWKMIAGTLKRYEGTAWIQPWGRNQTLLTYQMLAVPKGIAPAPMMATGLRKATAQVVQAIRKRIATRTAVRRF